MYVFDKNLAGVAFKNYRLYDSVVLQYNTAAIEYDDVLADTLGTRTC